MARTGVHADLTAILSAMLIAGGIWTFFLPLVKVNVPPIVSEQWSAWDMTKPLPKLFTKRESKWDMTKLDFDYLDVLIKILPKNQAGEGTKLSSAFWLGVSLPIALVLTYLALIFAALSLLLMGGQGLMTVALAALGTAIYSIFGVYYLGQVATQAFQNTVNARAQGFLGEVTKHFVQKITMESDMSLYVLCTCTLLLFFVQIYRFNTAPSRRRKG